MTSIDGHLWTGGWIPYQDTPYQPSTKAPVNLRDCSLRLRLCEDGPGMCPTCESPCGFGMEFLRRQEIRKNAGAAPKGRRRAHRKHR